MAGAEVAAEGAPSRLPVEVVCSPGPRQVARVTILVPAGTTAAEACRLSGLPARWPEAFAPDGVLAVWGRTVAPEAVLRAGDRVEACRPLRVDPKEARRVRYRAQGERGRRPVSGTRSR